MKTLSSPGVDVCLVAHLSLLNCLCAAVPPRERVVSCEEVFELRLHLPDWVAMQTRQPNLEGTGEIPLRRLVKEALRMRPSRIIVGEVRQEECLDLLIALNSGLPSIVGHGRAEHVPALDKRPYVWRRPRYSAINHATCSGISRRWFCRGLAVVARRGRPPTGQATPPPAA